MADLPTTLRLGSHTIEVRTDDDTAQLLRDEGARGDSRPDKHLIRIDPAGPHTAIAQTMLHEITHVAWHQTPLRCDDTLTEREEAVITALTPWTLLVLRDNPALVDYLTA